LRLQQFDGSSYKLIGELMEVWVGFLCAQTCTLFVYNAFVTKEMKMSRNLAIELKWVRPAFWDRSIVDNRLLFMDELSAKDHDNKPTDKNVFARVCV
jgi:hypothetical protein